jgi:hypothetical protein
MLPWVVGAVTTTEPGLEPQQSRELEAIVRSLSEREHLKDLLVQVVDSLVLWTGVERGLLLLRAPDGRLVPRAARNLARADLHGDQLALSRPTPPATWRAFIAARSLSSCAAYSPSP